jgi:hypothetical protein
MFYGFWGALLGFGIVSGAIFFWQTEIQNFFSPISVLPTELNIVGLIFAGELLAGALLGLIAAWLATRRYLKR